MPKLRYLERRPMHLRHRRNQPGHNARLPDISSVPADHHNCHCSPQINCYRNFRAVVQSVTNGVTMIKRIKTDKSDERRMMAAFYLLLSFDHRYAFFAEPDAHTGIA
jgi:hypothetical protein